MPIFGVLSSVGHGGIGNFFLADDLATAEAVTNLSCVEIPEGVDVSNCYYDGKNFIKYEGETNA